jgi:uncharacterized membrane protein (TIGR02234 family)
MTPGRLRLVAFVLLALTAGGLFLAWSQPWFTLAVSRQEIVVRGDVAAGALPPLALVSLALILALALAGTVFRVLLGVLEALVGVGAVVATAFAIANPAVVSIPSITKATGIAGEKATALVESTGTTGWPALAIVAGALGILTGLYVAVTARAWPTGGRRFSRTRTEPEEGVAAATDPVREWDALSEGEDPTDRTP